MKEEEKFNKRKHDKKINQEQIVEAISDIQEFCGRDIQGTKLSEQQEIKRVWFALGLLTKIPIEKKTTNGFVLVSSVVTKRVIDDLIFLLRDRFNYLKDKGYHYADELVDRVEDG